MQDVLILGAGTAGTTAANRLRRKLDRDRWRITVVDRDDAHLYQPGLLLLPFGKSRPQRLVRSRRRCLHRGVSLVSADIDRVEPTQQQVLLADGRRLDYDYLVIATGSSPRPDQTPGLTGPQWRRSIFDFYTLDGATALRDALAAFEGGRVLVHVVENPIKCPVAPLEFAFLADAYFADRGIRDRTDLTYVTPLDGAFTRPVAADQLGGMLERRRIGLETDFVVERVDPDRKVLVSMDERELAFDLLVTVPLMTGADFVARSGLGDELNYVPVDPHTLLCTAHDTIFALGDAADVPTSKAGSVAHFEVELFVDNFADHVRGRPMRRDFDGHANCFVESGHGKGLLLDFNYDTEPLPGSYPLPVIGPFSLLAETRVNHWGKLAFRWLYWNVLLPGRPMPVSARMPRSGKRLPGKSLTSTHAES
jgi:sulfide:quinone oxidoreductase